MKGLWGWGIALSRGSVEGASGRAPLPGTRKMNGGLWKGKSRK